MRSTFYSFRHRRNEKILLIQLTHTHTTTRRGVFLLPSGFLVKAYCERSSLRSGNYSFGQSHWFKLLIRGKVTEVVHTMVSVGVGWVWGKGTCANSDTHTHICNLTSSVSHGNALEWQGSPPHSCFHVSLSLSVSLSFSTHLTEILMSPKRCCSFLSGCFCFKERVTVLRICRHTCMKTQKDREAHAHFPFVVTCACIGFVGKQQCNWYHMYVY